MAHVVTSKTPFNNFDLIQEIVDMAGKMDYQFARSVHGLPGDRVSALLCDICQHFNLQPSNYAVAPDDDIMVFLEVGRHRLIAAIEESWEATREARWEDATDPLPKNFIIKPD